MSKRPVDLLLDDICEALDRIGQYTGGMSFDVFSKDRKSVDAVVRNLEIIGEAAAHVPPETRLKYPEIEWKKVVGLRNILIHNYSGVDLEIVWDIIKNRLDLLEVKTRQALNEEKIDYEE